MARTHELRGLPLVHNLKCPPGDKRIPTYATRFAPLDQVQRLHFLIAIRTGIAGDEQWEDDESELHATGIDDAFRRINDLRRSSRDLIISFGSIFMPLAMPHARVRVHQTGQVERIGTFEQLFAARWHIVGLAKL
jgi:hypothetical protein